MSDAFSIDANILICGFDHRYPIKQAVARDLVRRARHDRWIVTIQTIGEFFNAVTRKSLLSRVDAAAAAERMMTTFQLASATSEEVAIALREAAAGHFSYWDAVMLATLAAANCTACFSEDMHAGGRFQTIEVVNPFGPNGLTERALRLLSPTL